MKKLLLLLLLIPSLCSAVHWEELHCNKDIFASCLYRMEVPHGWLVTKAPNFKDSITFFYPDEKHEWKL